MFVLILSFYANEAGPKGIQFAKRSLGPYSQLANGDREISIDDQFFMTTVADLKMVNTKAWKKARKKTIFPLLIYVRTKLDEKERMKARGKTANREKRQRGEEKEEEQEMSIFKFQHPCKKVLIDSYMP
uniref:Uncharacterized protein n=1 Tax=Romanomermis culicivorax TaxID=13658 RepID=A0A915KLY9_ROMCU